METAITPSRRTQADSYIQSGPVSIISTGGQSIISTGSKSISVSDFNVSETKNNVIVTMNISGFTADDITVKIEGNNIRINAQSGRGGNISTVSNSFPLPCQVSMTKMTKKLSNGILTITLPKVK